MYEKLLDIQREIGTIKKDATNPFFKSKYFNIDTLLEHVKPVLNKNGVVLLQGLGELNGKLALTTKLVDSKTKEEVQFTCPLPETPDAQKAGSAVSYFRRYALVSLLALEAEDDDGNTATKTPIKAPIKPKIDSKLEDEGFGN